MKSFLIFYIKLQKQHIQDINYTQQKFTDIAKTQFSKDLSKTQFYNFFFYNLIVQFIKNKYT